MAGLRVSGHQNGVVSPAAIGGESWEAAEMATRDVLCRVWPTLVADKKRWDIIEYLQSLVRYYIGCEIFPYGSVPLKTYLPDGDIDLTAVSPDIADAALASDVYAVLWREEHNEAARFKVKDVHRIDAEVKLVKCIIEDVVVDISFNQLGGLSALCFLEQIDRRVGNDHLFKRSIILMKTWCYYESRILGAHHGLISTYALEILVLHIFDVFRDALEGPLSVLYTFLVYFSGFDWENYCLSLKGPVGKSYQRDVAAEVPVNEPDDRLLNEDFLKSCREKFSVSSAGLETKMQRFPLKHLNIIDPLKENNNLGRSVSRGSFCRIRSAFKYGANKLGWILSLPAKRIADELLKFFSNSLDQNRSNCWNIVPDIVDTVGSFEVGGAEISSAFRKKPETQSAQDISSQFVQQFKRRLEEEVSKLLASGVINVRITDDSASCSCGNRCSNTSMFGCSCQASQSYTQTYKNRNVKTDNSGSSEEKLSDYSTTNDERKYGCSPKHKEKHAVTEEVACSFITPTNMAAFIDSMALIDVSKVSKIIDNLEKKISGVYGEAEALTLLLDLGGDYDNHFGNLRYGQLCHVYATSPNSCPVFLPPQHNNTPWRPARPHTQFSHSVDPQSCSRNGYGLGPHCYRTRNFRSSCATAFIEENTKSRGTGTYLPNSNFRPYKDRRSHERRRTIKLRTCRQFPRHDRNVDNWNVAPEEFPASPGWQCERSQAEYFGQCGWDSGSSDHCQFYYPPESWDSFQDNNIQSTPPENLAKASCSSSSPPNTQATPLPGTEFVPLPSHGPARSPVASTTKKCEPCLVVCEERVEEQAYRLKDEGDFPPLAA